MGYNLRNKQGKEFHFTQGEWPLLLSFARAHGWQPAGTLSYLPDWDGGYMANERQVVTDEDAAALAGALGAGFELLSDEATDKPKHIIVTKDTFDTLPEPARRHYAMYFEMPEFNDEGEPPELKIVNPHLTAQEYFSGMDKALVAHFIQYCRKGGFYIG
jgi:hypothetical protein